MLRRRILGPDCSTEALVGSGPPTRLSSPGRASRGTRRRRLYQQQTLVGCVPYKPPPPANPCENWLSPWPHSLPTAGGLTADAPGPLCVWGRGRRRWWGTGLCMVVHTAALRQVVFAFSPALRGTQAVLPPPMAQSTEFTQRWEPRGPLTATPRLWSHPKPTHCPDPSGTGTICGRQPCPLWDPGQPPRPCSWWPRDCQRQGQPSRGTKDRSEGGSSALPPLPGLSESPKTKDLIICREIPEDRAGSVLHPRPAALTTQRDFFTWCQELWKMMRFWSKL